MLTTDDFDTFCLDRYFFWELTFSDKKKKPSLLSPVFLVTTCFRYLPIQYRISIVT